MRAAPALLLPVLAILAATTLAQAQAQDGGMVPIAVDPRACRAIVEAPPPAAGAAYVPGVDARGRPVVPAEGPGGGPAGGPGSGGPDWEAAARSVTIAIEIDLARRLGRLPIEGFGYDPTARVGTLSFDDGVVRFNGIALDGEEKAQLRAACRRLDALTDAVRAGGKPPPPPSPAPPSPASPSPARRE